MKPPRVNRQPTVVYVQRPAPKDRSGDRAISAGWSLLIFGFVIACIPFLGFLAWALGAFLIFGAFISAIIGMANGRALGGIFLICGALIGAPVAYSLTPMISAALGGKAIEESTPAE